MCKECLLKWRSEVSWSCSHIATVLSQTLGDLHSDSFRICLSSRHPERSNSKHFNNALSDARLALLEEIFPAHQNYTITPWKWIKQQTTQALLLTACHCIQSAWLQTPQCIWTTAPLSIGRPVYYGERTPAEQCRFPFHFFLTLCSSSCSWIMAILFPDSWCHRLSHYSAHTNIWNEKEKKKGGGGGREKSAFSRVHWRTRPYRSSSMLRGPLASWIPSHSDRLPQNDPTAAAVHTGTLHLRHQLTPPPLLKVKTWGPLG